MRYSRASGIALIAIGGIFIGVTNNAHRTSTLGLITGIAMIVLGIVRIFLARKPEPPVT